MRYLLILALILTMWGPPISTFRDTSQATDIAASARMEFDTMAKFEIFYWFVIQFIFVLFVFKRILIQSRIFRTDIIKQALLCYLGFAILAMLSSLYSHYPLFTIYRSGQLLTTILVIVALYTEYSDKPFHAVNLICTLIFAFAFINLLSNISGYLLNPESVGKYTGVYGMQPRIYRLLGGLIFERDFGFAASVSLIFSMANILTLYNKQKDVKKLNIGYLALSIISIPFLFLPRVRASIISTIIAIVLMIFWSRKNTIPIIITLIIIALVSISTGLLNQLVSFIIRDPDTFRTASNRLPLWEYIIRNIGSNIWLGLGYSSAGKDFLLGKFHDGHRGLGNAHGSFVEALMGVGIPGLLCLSFTYILAWRGIFHISRINLGDENKRIILILVGLLTVFTLSSFTSDSSITPRGFITTVLVSILTMIQILQYSIPTHERIANIPDSQLE